MSEPPVKQVLRHRQPQVELRVEFMLHTVCVQQLNLSREHRLHVEAEDFSSLASGIHCPQRLPDPAPHIQSLAWCAACMLQVAHVVCVQVRGGKAQSRNHRA